MNRAVIRVRPRRTERSRVRARALRRRVNAVVERDVVGNTTTRPAPRHRRTRCDLKRRWRELVVGHSDSVGRRWIGDGPAATRARARSACRRGRGGEHCECNEYVARHAHDSVPEVVVSAADVDRRCAPITRRTAKFLPSCVSLPGRGYSVRNAVSGSTLAARRAGTLVAMSAITIITPAAYANTPRLPTPTR
jgi:hypothetical protein